MPKLTTKQMLEARKKKQAAEGAVQRARDEAREAKQQRLDQLTESEGTHALLTNVVEGLYDEVDKLAKKAPADEITDLALKRVNEFIRQAKSLLAGDAFIDSIDLFVAAGENPEYRDVLMILREFKQGLARQRAELTELSNELDPYDSRRRG